MRHTEGPSQTDVSHRRLLSSTGDTYFIQVLVIHVSHIRVLFCPGDTCVIQKVAVTQMCRTGECCPVAVTHASYRKSQWHGCVTQTVVVLLRWHWYVIQKGNLSFYILVSKISERKRPGNKLRHTKYFISTIWKFNSHDVGFFELRNIDTLSGSC
jgi:hypothetical protein